MLAANEHTNVTADDPPAWEPGFGIGADADLHNGAVAERYDLGTP